jgi:1-acyl-sn-glycerol-3-phosphate acyltransferase
MDHAAYLERARGRGVNPIVYWLVRGVLQVFFHLYFRLSRIGREHIPNEGPVIVAANHRSFLDPFVIGTMARRPMYYVAKKELFRNRLQSWILSALGAFPIDRGSGDKDAMATARELLERGECVLIFPEGTRVRPGPLGRPKRGVGRLALETGAPVVPVAVFGTEKIRRGWRIRPHKVRIRAGRALRFPQVDKPSPQLAGAVTDRIWPCVELQWEWLGGAAPIRRVAIVGAGSWGTALAAKLANAGASVELGARTPEQAERIAGERVNERYLPGIRIPDEVRVAHVADLQIERADLVVLAVPAKHLAACLDHHGQRIQPRTGVLVLAKGLMAPSGALPGTYVAEHTSARAVACLGGPGHAADAVTNGASLVAASMDRDFAEQLAELLNTAGLEAQTTTDITGVELAGAAKNAAVIAAAAAATAGPNAAGAAAGKVFAEVDAFSRRRGGRPETFAGLAGAGDLVATVVAEGSRNRRAGDMLGRGMAPDEIVPALGQAAEGLDAVPLLAAALRAEGVKAPALNGLAAVLAGQLEAEQWTGAITRPKGRGTTKAA